MGMEQYQISSDVEHVLKSSCIPFAIYTFNNEKIKTLLITDGFCELFDLTEDQAYELMDNNMYKHCHPEDRAYIADLGVKFAKSGQEYEAIYRNKSDKQNEYHVIHAYGRHVDTEGGRLAVVWYTDETNVIKKSKEAGAVGGEDIITHLEKLLQVNKEKTENNYESLTGLPNLPYFFQLAGAGTGKMAATGKRGLIAFFDFLGMTAFNRRFGFEEGTQLLLDFSQILAKYFTAENCTRVGGNYFAVYDEYTEEFQSKLEKVVEETATLHDGKSIPISVGVYVFEPDQSLSPGMGFDFAKEASAINKGSHESVIRYYDDELKKKAAQRNYVINNFERALEEHWIQAYYQAIIRSVNGAVCSEEALARWIDPDTGMLSPAEFIPVLENAHLLYKLDLYMVEQICQDMKAKQANGIDIVPTSVNFSRYDFEQCDVVDEVIKRVDAAGLPHKLLAIEITESVVGMNPEYIKEQVARFRQNGFFVWMDDFGSGYSSLNLLQDLEFDLIKLDLKLVKTLDTSQKSRSIVKKLVEMTTSINIDTLAEGVETVNQFNFLKEIGCDKLQGFCFSKPTPFNEICDRYRNGKGIGFEDYREHDYYETISRVPLSDISPVLNTRSDMKDTNLSIPAAVIERNEEQPGLCLRANNSYIRKIKADNYLEDSANRKYGFVIKNNPYTEMIRDAMERSDNKYGWNYAKDDYITIAVKKIATNPVTGAMAYLVIFLNMES